MTLVILLENLHNTLEKRGMCHWNVSRLSKGIDTENHGILLGELSHYGLRGPDYDWFSIYLNERYQFVVYNGCESEHKYI